MTDTTKAAAFALLVSHAKPHFEAARADYIAAEKRALRDNTAEGQRDAASSRNMLNGMNHALEILNKSLTALSAS
jgi:hypothetical protein